MNCTRLEYWLRSKYKKWHSQRQADNTLHKGLLKPCSHMFGRFTFQNYPNKIYLCQAYYTARTMVTGESLARDKQLTIRLICYDLSWGKKIFLSRVTFLDTPKVKIASPLSCHFPFSQDRAMRNLAPTEVFSTRNDQTSTGLKRWVKVLWFILKVFQQINLGQQAGIP